MTNPLLSDWIGEFALPPFAAIRDEDFSPAFDRALQEARAAIAAIGANPEPPTFDNTVAAMELAEGLLDRVSGVFYNLAGADSTPAREALQRDLAPKMAAFSSEVTMNAALFARIEALWAAREGLGLTAERARVLELYRQMFVRAGAGLKGADRGRMSAIKERLAVLSTAFSQNLLADERAWFSPAERGRVGRAARFRGGSGPCRRGRTRRRRPGADAEPVADRAILAVLAAPRSARDRL